MVLLIKNPLWVYVCVLFLLSCSRYPQDVEDALLLSGNNKTELIQALEHYKNRDKLKYEAACFLISNMRYHESRALLELTGGYQTYFAKIDSILRVDSFAIHNDSLKRELNMQFDSITSPIAKECMIPDIQNLSSCFIIDNIEQSFSQWQHSPLLKNISFDEFKEWILPYRVMNEELVGNKQVLHSILYEKVSENGMDDIYRPIECYKRYVRMQKDMNKYIKSRHHIGPFDLFIPAFTMDCSNLAIRTCNYFRACGIPVVYEFTPQWPDKNSRHYWCASPDSNGVLQPYTPPYNNLREDWPLDLKYAGKVFQQTFGITKDSPYFLKNENEIIPEYFNTPTIKDVTDRYHTCISVTLNMGSETDNNLAYLSFSNTENDFTPVAWGKLNHKKGTVRFDKVPINMLFFPSCIGEDGNAIPFGNPFMLRRDSSSGFIVKEELIGDMNHKIQMHLLRKYPSKRHLVKYRENLRDAKLLASDHWSGIFDTLLTITDTPEPYWQEYKITNKKKYRYYKFETNNKSSVNIAEFEFLGEKEAIHKYAKPTPLPVFFIPDNSASDVNEYVKIIGTPIKAGPLFYRAYDSNPETYVESPYLGMDFKNPVCIRGFRMLPRNAMNIIEPANRYRLLYYDKGKWIELSDFLSEYNYLHIDSVPAGTIYWLQNLDKGKEELPFFYKNNKQIFINQYM